MSEILQESEAEITQLNRTVARLKSEISSTRKELDDFAYAVSHDLRAPLRAIDGFSRIVDEDFGGTLGSEARELLENIRSNSARMGRLMDALLDYSRLGRQELKPSEIDMAALAQSVWDGLVRRQEKDASLLNPAILPVVTADVQQLRLVWAELFSNCLKFKNPGQPARVSVSATETGDEKVFCVEDEGQGFDSKYAGRLFTLFQRLHSDALEGTGAGLAKVRRVIARHGGRTWAEGRPGQGASFYFTLPVTGESKSVAG